MVQFARVSLDQKFNCIYYFLKQLEYRLVKITLGQVYTKNKLNCVVFADPTISAFDKLMKLNLGKIVTQGSSKSYRSL